MVVEILKRDEWSENEYYVAPASLRTFVANSESYRARPFYLDIGAEPVKVIYKSMWEHTKDAYGMKLQFNRFVMNRPNPVILPIYPVNDNQCADHALGANINWITRHLELWTYTDIYPPRIEVDISLSQVGNPVRLGDVEKLLPEGVFLHKKYQHRLYQPIITLEETRVFKARKILKEKREKEFQAKKREIELGLNVKKDKKKKIATKKSVPEVVQSTKQIMKNKDKILKVIQGT